MEMFPAERAPTVRRLSLVRLSAEIARSVAGVGRVAVEGEVVQPGTARSGTVYFTLRDRAAQITVVCPRARVSRCRTVHGERVCVTGALGYSNERGQLQLVADEVSPVGEGAILAAIADVRRRLGAEGLLDRVRRPLPLLPRAVGVVCGADAAVRADIESVVVARFPGYPVAFKEVAVSGPGAAEAVIGALQGFDAARDVDVIILARGGGDPASLLPFSDEELCRAICASTTPVVTAIGHERDRPLCDEVADRRYGTPSLAAAAVVPDETALQSHVDTLLESVRTWWVTALRASAGRLEAVDLPGALRAGLSTATDRLDRAAGRLQLVDLGRRVDDAGRRLASVDWRAPITSRLATLDGDLSGRRRTLDALDPDRVLSRGYAIVRTADGTVVRSPAQVSPGEELGVAVAQGRIHAAVTATETESDAQ
ncbi:MAG TPA: exodeoxyribonuclease VII large subunit [Acidimicrobiales bacterium]|nr:exodeoxyribonuclease VII large subunit [Acidimicrobiales bacterium]